MSILWDIKAQLIKSALETRVHSNTLQIQPSSADNYCFIQRYLTQLHVSFHTKPFMRSMRSRWSLKVYLTPPPLMKSWWNCSFWAFTQPMHPLTETQESTCHFLPSQTSKFDKYEDYYDLHTFMYLKVKAQSFDSHPGHSQYFN